MANNAYVNQAISDFKKRKLAQPQTEQQKMQSDPLYGTGIDSKNTFADTVRNIYNNTDTYEQMDDEWKKASGSLPYKEAGAQLLHGITGINIRDKELQDYHDITEAWINSKGKTFKYAYKAIEGIGDLGMFIAGHKLFTAALAPAVLAKAGKGSMAAKMFRSAQEGKMATDLARAAYPSKLLGLPMRMAAKIPETLNFLAYTATRNTAAQGMEVLKGRETSGGAVKNVMTQGLLDGVLVQVGAFDTFRNQIVTTAVLNGASAMQNLRTGVSPKDVGEA